MDVNKNGICDNEEKEDEGEEQVAAKPDGAASKCRRKNFRPLKSSLPNYHHQNVDDIILVRQKVNFQIGTICKNAVIAVECVSIYICK
jgi:hypothetical protein